MSAKIRITLNLGIPPIGDPTEEISRDDLQPGTLVTCYSVDAADSYSWGLVHKPDSTGGGLNPTTGIPSTATMSAASSRTTTFQSDYDGSYLVQLTVNSGLPSESTQYVRLRQLTRFAGLHLPAAGERNDDIGRIPSDISPMGWSGDQNDSIQRLLLLARRQASSGRVLWVDANRGRDTGNDQNDPLVLVEIPGPNPAAPTESGLSLVARAHGDFASINAAISYAVSATPPPSEDNPWVVLVQPGLYVEDVQFQPFVHVLGVGPSPQLNSASGAGYVHPVQVRTANGPDACHVFHGSATDHVTVSNLMLEGTLSGGVPVVVHFGGVLLFENCVIYQRGTDPAQSPALLAEQTGLESPRTILNDCVVASAASLCTVIAHGARAGALSATRTTVLATDAGLGLDFNFAMYGGTVDGFSEDTELELKDCDIGSANLYGSRHTITRSTFLTDRSPLTGSLLFIPASGTRVGGLEISLDAVQSTGNLLVDVGGLSGGASSLVYSSVSFPGRLVFPGGTPDTFSAGPKAQSLAYEPTYLDPVTGLAVLPERKRLTATNLQEAIDAILLEGINNSVEYAIPVSPLGFGGSPVRYLLGGSQTGHAVYDPDLITLSFTHDPGPVTPYTTSGQLDGYWAKVVGPWPATPQFRKIVTSVTGIVDHTETVTLTLVSDPGAVPTGYASWQSGTPSMNTPLMLFGSVTFAQDSTPQWSFSNQRGSTFAQDTGTDIASGVFGSLLGITDDGTIPGHRVPLLLAYTPTGTVNGPVSLDLPFVLNNTALGGSADYLATWTINKLSSTSSDMGLAILRGTSQLEMIATFHAGGITLKSIPGETNLGFFLEHEGSLRIGTKDSSLGSRFILMAPGGDGAGTGDAWEIVGVTSPQTYDVGSLVSVGTSRKIQNLANGSASSDAVNKGQLDAVINGAVTNVTVSGYLSRAGTGPYTVNANTNGLPTSVASLGAYSLGSSTTTLSRYDHVHPHTPAVDGDPLGTSLLGWAVNAKSLTMTGDITMGTHAITGLADPTNPQDAATKAHVTTQIGTALLKAGGTMAGDIAMGTHAITGLADPTNPQDAATKAHVTTQIGTALLKAGGTMAGDIAMGTHAITGLADPTNPQDAATKNYIDTHGASEPTTTKGDISIFGAAATRLPVGTNGQQLIPDSTVAAGLKWFQNPVQIINVTFSGSAGNLTMAWTLNGVAQTAIALGAGTWYVLPLFAGLAVNETASFSSLIVGRSAGIDGGHTRYIVGLANRNGGTEVRTSAYAPTSVVNIPGSGDPSLPSIGGLSWGAGYCQAGPDGAPTRPAGMLAANVQHTAGLTTYWQVITTLARVTG